MRNITNRILLFCVLILFQVSCFNIVVNDDDSDDIRIEGKGELVEKEISVNDFSSISNIGVLNLNISKGEETSVKLRAQENLMQYITCKTQNNDLKIGVEDNIQLHSVKGLYADIVMRNDIESINIVGTGNTVLVGERQENLSINITGTGNVDAYQLEVDDCIIMSTGTGNCKVFVNNNLSVTITGIAKVFYKGNPKIQQQIIGIGGVIDSN